MEVNPLNPPELLLQAQRFRVIRQRYRTQDGAEHERETVVHPGAVTIIPLLDDRRVCLIRNFRPSVGQTLIELPAGTLNPGEEPMETARRELQEETGYLADAFEWLCEFFMSPGILSERMVVYVARGLHPGATRLDAGEQIEPLIVTWDEALRMVDDRRIQDAKTIAALLRYDRQRNGRVADAGPATRA